MLLLTTFAKAQSLDFSDDLMISIGTNHKKSYKHYFIQSDTEVELLYTGLFVGYKKFISSQDGSTCSFHPSCSEYAVQSIKKHGLIKGVMMFFDRYTRCNSLSPGFYKVDKERMRYVDEVGKF
jgi:uncharacterized protein